MSPTLIALVVLSAILVAAIYASWTGELPVGALSQRYVRPADRRVQVDGNFYVRVRDQGSKSSPALLLLHGTGDSLEAWDRVAPFLETEFRLLSIDLPGHGLTGPDPRGDYTPARLAVVLDRVLDDARVKRVTVVGNSMGGWLAWHYARLRPTRLDRLVLVDAFGAPNQAAVELPLAFRIARWPVVRHSLLRFTPRSAVADGLIRSSYNSAWIDDGQIDRHWLFLRRAGNRQAMLDQFQVLQPNAEPSAFRAIHAPTLILWGKEDRLIPFQNGLWLANHISNSEFVILDRAGHLPMQEDPRRFSAILLKWLSTHRSASIACDHSPVIVNKPVQATRISAIGGERTLVGAVGRRVG